VYTTAALVPKLTPIVDGVMFSARAHLRFYGLPMGTRMTVVKLPDGRLWVHSPILLDTVKDDLDALGEVAFVVAPNFIHHLYVGPFLEAYPKARLFLSPKLMTKRADLVARGGGELGDEAPDNTWGDVIDQAPARGSKVMDEIVFLHRPTRTLILCDLLECVHARAPRWVRVVGKLAGIYERPGPPIDMKLSFSDHAATRAFVDRVLAWDFDRVVMSHGDVIETGGKEAFRSAYAFAQP
jgi:hypothetical protein